jgi:hypothetical protein
MINDITLADALNSAGIVLPSHTIDRTHRAPCPHCDRGPKDGALAVTIHSNVDAVWICHRCGWSGGWRARERMPARPVDHGQHLPKATHASGLSDFGRRIWDQAKPVTADDLAGRHLARRCCALPKNDVRLHGSVWHPRERRAFPAMVALVTDIRTAAAMSLHLTYLDPNGGGKAKIEQPRLYLAGHRKAGGVVRLHPDYSVTQGLIVGEGLETCLTYALEFAPVWACLDAGNLAAFPVLSGLEGLTVLVDHDDAGRRAFGAVRDRWRAAGFTNGLDVIGVEVAGKPGSDVNDLVAIA